MSLYARELTRDEHNLLQGLANSDDTVQARWAQIVLLSASGLGVPVIADTLELSAATVRARIKAFNDRGVDALARSASPGRPETISPSLGDQLAALMNERQPRDFRLGRHRLDPGSARQSGDAGRLGGKYQPRGRTPGPAQEQTLLQPP